MLARLLQPQLSLFSRFTTDQCDGGAKPAQLRAHRRPNIARAAGDGGKGLNWPTRDAVRTEDRDGRLVALFASDWVRRYTEEKNPGVVFRAMG